MARVEVTAGTLAEGKIKSLDVRLSGLPDRTIDREQALAWMKDGHSFIPMVQGQPLPALELVEVLTGDEINHFIRADTARESADSLPFSD
ncbi:MAG: hypothetical protein EA397_01735 [Deltaproteobacteria bacterium]|nr:MAG: hypothetical protein EA397_01735 [Deltaproteobacteria bacterium]